MHETEHSKPVHCDSPEGWDGEGDGRGIQEAGHVHPWWFMSMYGKNHYNIVTSLQLNLKNKRKKVEVTLEKIMFH